jgi:RNA polymerase sigma factor (sigma-70 family)
VVYALIALVLADDEDALVEGLIAGEPEAAAVFVRKFTPRVRRAVQSARIPSADIEDVTQEILIEALRQLRGPGFELRSTLGHWLKSVAFGRVTDYWRASSRRGRGKHVSLDAVDASKSSLRTLPDQEALVLAEEALALLHPRHQIALIGFFRADVSVKELASQFGLSPQRTRAVIAKARELFCASVRSGEKKPRQRRLKE